MKSDEYELESSLIGALIQKPTIFPEVAAKVKADDFLTPQGKRCFLAIADKFGKEPIDLASIYVSLVEQSDKAFVTESIDTIPVNTLNFAGKIADLARKRRLIKRMEEISAKARRKDTPSDWILEDIVATYKAETGDADRDCSISAVVDRFIELQRENREKGQVGLNTGFEKLTRDYIFYQPGHLWVVGAWTSVGKSAWMIESIMRFYNANQNGKVAVFSTEMTEAQNLGRMMANITGVNSQVIISGNMIDQHQNQVHQNLSWIKQKRMFIFDRLRNIDDILAQSRRLQYSGGVDLIFIDFIQNVYRNGEKDNYMMMSRIAKDVQALAHDLSCTVICLSQLPTGAAKDDAGLLEFKGAGEIAAACDVGVLMKAHVDDPSQILFDVRKNRHGKRAKYDLKFDRGFTRIIEKEAIQ
jgi:replicative DNA helicase